MARCSKCICVQDSEGNLVADCNFASAYDIGEATCDANDGQIDDFERFKCYYDRFENEGNHSVSVQFSSVLFI